jgi:hypothetical protein
VAGTAWSGRRSLADEDSSALVTAAEAVLKRTVPVH